MSHKHELEDSSAFQHDAEHQPAGKNHSVVLYLAILFAAAFFLLLMSYFMQQRSNQEAITGLRQSISSMDSMEDMVAENTALEEEVAGLDGQIAALNDQIAALQQEQTDRQALSAQQEAQLAAAQAKDRELQAMDWFWRIMRLYYRGENTKAIALADAFAATGLVPSLPQTSLSDPAGRSPQAQYQAILDSMGYTPATP